MAYDKVVDSAVLDAGLKQIADAIREKAGTTDALAFPQEIADAIAAIQGGGATIEPLTISENGTYTAPDGVDGYSPVTVSVVPPESDIDEFIARSIKNVSSAEEKVGSYAFANCTSLESVDFPNAKTIDEYAFYMSRSTSGNMTGRTFVVNFPEVETIGEEAFSTVDNSDYKLTLEYANFPKAKTIKKQAFYKCRSLREVYFPEVTKIESSAFGSNQGSNEVTKAAFPKLASASYDAFNKWYSVKLLDLGKLSSFGSQMVQSDYSLIAVVLRSETLCTLAGKYAFDGCSHFEGEVNSTYNPDGLKDGYIYVPRALIEDYKVATNWVTFADQFRALEDYTVDGTITGEIDESKVGL